MPTNASTGPTKATVQLRAARLATLAVTLGLAALPSLCAAAKPAEAAKPEASAIAKEKPQIEVCFVLDTTGSMSGLIEGAKKKIWSIANTMVSAKPTPQIKFALVGYRDRKDEYVVKTHPLTDDLDAVYAKLNQFSAGGGGDTPEAVNQALEEAVRRTQWSTDAKTLRIIFLVGDAPPHMDYPDDVKYPVLCGEALKKGIIINTVQCGADGETRRIWQEIAKLSEGEYSAIAQEGGMQIVSTPFDERLSTLNREVGKTIVPYGGAATRSTVVAKQKAAEAAPAPAASDRLAFNAATGKAVQGGGDLLDALKDGQVKSEDIKPDLLPEDWRKMDGKERSERIATNQKERTKLQDEIATLSRQRADYLRDEEKKQAAAGKGDGFDNKVRAAVISQAKRRGVELK